MAVSYVVTVYNKAAYLEAALASIEAERQASGGEIILVDDGSTDSSGEILARFAAAHPAASLFSQPNKGVVGATNSGFLRADPGCAALRFCDADDLLVPGSSAVLQEALRSCAAEVVFGRYETYRTRPADPLPAVVSCGAQLLEKPLRAALRRNLFSPSSTLLARRAAERIFPLPETFRTSQDYMMGLRACFYARIARIDAALSLGPDDDAARLSADPARMYGETARFVAEEILARPEDWQAADARYALRRNAGRALLWARRGGGPAGAKIKLSALKHASHFHDKASAARSLIWIAENVYGLRP